MTQTSRPLKTAVVLFSAMMVCAPMALATDASAEVKLLDHAVVRSNRVMLSNLLPENAPESLKELAARAELGAAPQPEVTLRISRAQIEAAIENRPDLAASLVIPASVEIERFHRALSSKEIARALNAEARRRGLKGDDPLGLTGLTLTAPVTVTTLAPGLRVTSVQSDELRHVTRFQLVAHNEPQLVPFTIWVPRLVTFPEAGLAKTRAAGTKPTPGAVQRPAGAKAPAAARIAAGPVPFRPPRPKPVLVEPGALATLLVTGKGFTIKAVVIPLQEGSMGQQIRVRNLVTHRVLSAEVTGRNSLRSTL